MAEIVATTVDDSHVALLRLNRPEARNALSPEMMERIASELERLDPDPQVRCIVIAGSEKAFAAGADMRAMSERSLCRRPSTTPRPPSGGGSPGSRPRWSRRSAAARSAVAASWPLPAT